MPEEKRPRLARLFLWLLGGDFGFELKERTVPPALQVMFRRQGMSDFFAGVMVMSLPKALSVVLSPITGYLSDRWRSPWGRRIPFFFVLVPVAVASMFAMAALPKVGALCVFWVVFEICSVSSNAVFLGLIADVVPRSFIARFFGFFRVASLTAAVLFNLFLLGEVGAHFSAVCAGVAVVYALSFGFMCLKVREGKHPPPEPVPGSAHHRFFAAVRLYVRLCFSDSYYALIFLAVTLGGMSLVPLNVYTIYYAQSLGMSLGTLGRYNAIQLALSLLQAVPIGWLGDRIHPLRMTMIGAFLYGLSALVAYFVVRGPLAFGVASVICGSLSGFWYTAAAPLGPALFPKETFGTFNGALQLTYALGMMIIGPACGWYLDHVNHDYRCVYVWTAVPAGLALVATYAVYRRTVAKSASSLKC